MRKLAAKILILGMLPMVAWAKSASIGYELLNENQDSKAKTYTVTFAVWSVDKDANQLRVTAETDAPGLEILTKAKEWKGVKKGQHKEATFSVRNASGETRNLVLKIQRLAGGKTVHKDEEKTEHFDDTKEVSIMVPAP